MEFPHKVGMAPTLWKIEHFGPDFRRVVLRPEVQAWVNDSVKNPWDIHAREVEGLGGLVNAQIVFVDKGDAALFRMFWS